MIGDEIGASRVWQCHASLFGRGARSVGSFTGMHAPDILLRLVTNQVATAILCEGLLDGLKPSPEQQCGKSGRSKTVMSTFSIGVVIYLL
jgi:hypothetical protein